MFLNVYNESNMMVDSIELDEPKINKENISELLATLNLHGYVKYASLVYELNHFSKFSSEIIRFEKNNNVWTIPLNQGSNK